MTTSSSSQLLRSATVARWLARILSVLILMFWGFFIVAHLIGKDERSTRPLSMSDTVGLASMVVSLVGLALAWKWELTGGALTLAAVLIGASVNWAVLMFPYTLIPVDALLFLVSWWMSREAQHEPAVMGTTDW